MYGKDRPLNRTDDPIPVDLAGPLPYETMVDYIRARPEKLVSFVAGRLCDDDMRPLARELYEVFREEEDFDPREWEE